MAGRLTTNLTRYMHVCRQLLVKRTYSFYVQPALLLRVIQVEPYSWKENFEIFGASFCRLRDEYLQLLVLSVKFAVNLSVSVFMYLSFIITLAVSACLSLSDVYAFHL